MGPRAGEILLMLQLIRVNALVTSTVFLCFIVLFAFFERPTLALPVLVSCLTLFTVFYSYQRKEIAGFVQISFFAFTATTLVLPFLYLVLFWSEAGIQNYYKKLDLQPFDLLCANLLIHGFFVGITFFLFLSKEIIPKKQHPRGERSPEDSQDVYFGRLVLILFISIAAKIYLIATGGWAIINHEFQSNAFTHTARVLEKLDLFIYFILIYKKKEQTISQRMIATLFIFVPISLGLAMISGSKEKMFCQGLVVLCYLAAANYKKLLFATLALLMITASSIFEVVNMTRSGVNQGLSFNEITEKVLSRFEPVNANPTDYVIFRRLDYHRPLATVIRESPVIPYEIKTDYLDNFIGLIPRSYWPSKPNIGSDYNEVGRELGLLNKTDFVTSVGISPLGEAYKQFGIFGLPLIVLFLGAFLAAVRLCLSERKMFGFATSAMIAIVFAPLNSFATLLPTILKLSFVLFGAKIFIEKPRKMKQGQIET